MELSQKFLRKVPTKTSQRDLQCRRSCDIVKKQTRTFLWRLGKVLTGVATAEIEIFGKSSWVLLKTRETLAIAFSHGWVCAWASASSSAPWDVSLPWNKRPWPHAPSASRTFSWFSRGITAYSEFKHSPSPQPIRSAAALSPLGFFHFDTFHREATCDSWAANSQRCVGKKSVSFFWWRDALN